MSSHDLGSELPAIESIASDGFVGELDDLSNQALRTLADDLARQWRPRWLDDDYSGIDPACVAHGNQIVSQLAEGMPILVAGPGRLSDRILDLLGAVALVDTRLSTRLYHTVNAALTDRIYATEPPVKRAILDAWNVTVGDWLSRLTEANRVRRANRKENPLPESRHESRNGEPPRR